MCTCTGNCTDVVFFFRRQGDGEKMNDSVGERQNVWHIE